jgi:hypothetical protein
VTIISLSYFNLLNLEKLVRLFFCSLFSLLEMKLINFQHLMKLDSALIVYLILLVFIISTLITILLTPDFTNWDHSNLGRALDSTSPTICFVSLIIASLPMFVDFLMDSLVGGIETPREKLYRCSRLILTLSTFLVGIQFTLFPKGFFDIFQNHTVSYLYSGLVLRSTIFTTIFFSLRISKPKLFKFRDIIFLSLFMNISLYLRFYSIGTSGHLITLSKYLTFFFVPILFFFIVYWVRVLFRERNNYKIDEFTSILFLCMLLLLELSTIQTYFQHSKEYSLLDRGLPYIVFDTIIIVICLTLITLVPGRIARLNSINLLVIYFISIFSFLIIFSSLLP